LAHGCHLGQELLKKRLLLAASAEMANEGTPERTQGECTDANETTEQPRQY
jgi:hypothetical protein